MKGICHENTQAETLHDAEENLHRDNAAEIVLRGIRYVVNLFFVPVRVLRAFVVK